MRCRSLISARYRRARSIQKRLTELWNYEQYGYSWLDDKSRMPVKNGSRYFYVEKSGSQNQGVLYWATALDAKPAVLVDPNTLSSDATASLADYSISPDGRYVAYAVSDGGTDWDTWHVREVESGRDLPDLIGDTKFTGVSWLPDASAFYYSRYPKGADGKGDDQQQVSVYRHRSARRRRTICTSTRSPTTRATTRTPPCPRTGAIRARRAQALPCRPRAGWCSTSPTVSTRTRSTCATCRSPMRRSSGSSTSGTASTNSSARWATASTSRRRRARRSAA